MEFIEKIKFAAVCGIDCESECIIYRAYVNDNRLLRQQLAKELLGDRNRWPEIRCDGCKGEQAICYKPHCAVKTCARYRNYEFCYECNQYQCSQLIKTQEKNRKIRTCHFTNFK